MRSVKRIGVTAAGLGSLAVVAMGSTCADVKEIAAPTLPHVVLDFDRLAAGGVSVDEINDAFPGAGILELRFLESGDDGLTLYDSFDVGGRGLKPDGDGGLELLDPGGASRGEAVGLRILLDHPLNEFGIAIADKDSFTNRIKLFLHGFQIGDYDQQLSQDGTTRYLSSNVPFNEIRILESEDWVVPELVFDVTRPGPCSIGFWKDRSDGKEALLEFFPDGDLDAVVARAVERSQGLVANADGLLDALEGSGSRPLETRARQQTAALLLNLAAGDLFPLNRKCRLFENYAIAENACGEYLTVGDAVDRIFADFAERDFLDATSCADAANNEEGLVH